MALINNKEKRVITVPCIPEGSVQPVDTLTLLPGVNDVEDKKWAMARGSVKETKIDKGLIKEENVEVKEENVVVGKDDKGEDIKKKQTVVKSQKLSDLKPGEASELIKKTFSMATLKKWKKDESRDSVRKEILNQIEFVEKYGENSKDKKDKEDAAEGEGK